MTGTELSAALAEKLKMLLPDCAVRPAFTGTLQRLPQRAAVTVGVMQEENADGVFETVLGVQLYARERDDHARLFDAVCAAVSSLPSTIMASLIISITAVLIFIQYVKNFSRFDQLQLYARLLLDIFFIVDIFQLVFQ